MSDVLLLEKLEGRVGLLTVNRPDKMNALNNEVRDSLFAALEALRHDDDVRVVVITGSGDRAFIAGADIGEFKDAGAVDSASAGVASSRWRAISGSLQIGPSWVSPR